MSSQDVDWHQRWDAGRIGFHRDEVHPDLIGHERHFLGRPGQRVLVPLCGKSVDMAWLAARGYDVVGVEIVPRAVECFFDEQGLVAERKAVGRFTVWRAPGMTLLCGDFFDLRPEDLGPIDRVWDRAALVAIPTGRRSEYVGHLRGLLQPDWVLLQNAFEYDQSVMGGPPWSVPEAEVREHYGDCDVEVLHTEDVIDRVRWKDLGHRYWLSTTYLIRAG